MFKRPLLSVVLKRLQGRRYFIQVLAGPRQSGKTTLVQQALRELKAPSHYATADEPTLRDRIWLAQQWETARRHLESISKRLQPVKPPVPEQAARDFDEAKIITCFLCIANQNAAAL